MAKVFVKWEQITDYVNKVADDIKNRGMRPTGVYGPPRGGLIFAVMLSYKMNIPLLLNAAQGCIIIDDIADSGRTLLHFRENDTQFNRYYITTMYYHERSAVVPDLWVYNKKDDWIVFPYEEI